MTLNDRERPDWSKKHVYDSRTSDRTRFIESYENAKKMEAEAWKDYEDTKRRRDRGELDGKRDSPDTLVKWAKDDAKAEDKNVEEFKRGLAEMDYKKNKGINYVPRLSNFDWWRWYDKEGNYPEKARRR